MAGAMPMPQPSPEHSGSEGASPSPLPKGGDDGTTEESQDRSLDAYVASLVGVVDSTPLIETRLAELLLTPLLSDLLTGRVPAELLLSHIANLFWSLGFDLFLTHLWDEQYETSPFVINYTSGGSTRFDLAWFSRRTDEPKIRPLVELLREGELKVDADDFRFPQFAPAEQVSLEERYSKLVLRLFREAIIDGNDVFDVFVDYIRKQQPRLIELPMPPIEPQAAVPSQAISVTDQPGGILSTVGVVAVNASGQTGVTVAAHALAKAGVTFDDRILVGGKPGKVLWIDQVSDSAFVQPLAGVHFGTTQFLSRLQSVGPGANQSLTFSGVATANGTARVIGTPLTLTLKHTAIQRQLYTDYVTLPGDSGCASFDPSGNLVGFCFGGSGTESPAQFSIWIWADSVFEAHQLH